MFGCVTIYDICDIILTDTNVHQTTWALTLGHYNNAVVLSAITKQTPSRWLTVDVIITEDVKVKQNPVLILYIISRGRPTEIK